MMFPFRVLNRYLLGIPNCPCEFDSLMSSLCCIYFFHQLSVQVTVFHFLPQTVSMGRRLFGASFQLVFRLIKGLIFVTFISVLILLIAVPHMTAQDIIVCVLAFMPTGWGLLLVSKSHFFFIPFTYCIL